MVLNNGIILFTSIITSVQNVCFELTNYPVIYGVGIELRVEKGFIPIQKRSYFRASSYAKASEDKKARFF